MLWIILAAALGLVFGIGIYHIWIKTHPTWVAGIESLEGKAQSSIDKVKGRQA